LSAQHPLKIRILSRAWKHFLPLALPLAQLKIGPKATAFVQNSRRSVLLLKMARMAQLGHACSVKIWPGSP
jgi:hypothetical protein